MGALAHRMGGCASSLLGVGGSAHGRPHPAVVADRPWRHDRTERCDVDLCFHDSDRATRSAAPIPRRRFRRVRVRRCRFDLRHDNAPGHDADVDRRLGASIDTPSPKQGLDDGCRGIRAPRICRIVATRNRRAGVGGTRCHSCPLLAQQRPVQACRSEWSCAGVRPRRICLRGDLACRRIVHAHLIASVVLVVLALWKASKARPDLRPALAVVAASALSILIGNALNPMLQAPGHFWSVFLLIACINVALLSKPQTD